MDGIGLAICFFILMSSVANAEPFNLTPGERQWLIKFHRQHRSKVDPPAANMMFLKYSIEVEHEAASKLLSCDAKNISKMEMKGYNWNLALSTKGRASVEELATAWGHQKAHFNASKDGSCMNCGEYKKMVWANSRNMGCAKAGCNNSSALLCLYSPGGNWSTEQPYLKGISCSGCKGNVTCTQNQCDPEGTSKSKLGTIFWGIMAAIFYTFFE
ncbi:Glioma pathogenesis-related protein 1 [Echinococcus granulosus]|nr:Glioma pathogenesis-related protein 1 [Echinococcus granulosus]CDS23126.1 Allergen V5 Tpx 1 [Echinococcus granulosus]